MKKLTLMLCLLCLSALLAVPASAAGPLNYTIDAPGDPDYGKPTSIEPVITADGGVRKNEDVSKNAALIPPGFGTASADTLNTGTPLTPNLAPGYTPATGAVVNGTSAPVVIPGSAIPDTPTLSTPSASVTTTGYTEVTSDLYYAAGHLGTLKIPAIGLSVKVYEGTDSGTLMRGAGHFEETSIWDGNVAFAAHNRGVNNHFGKIHTLELGDEITLTTKLGTRTYEVVSVSKVSETDRSGLAASTENMITLYTCVMDQRAYRWQVQAVEI
ncbi:class D sortase [Flavonifractor sp. An100]|uniref:class D sortase n=1 Tax=Flavonifractor sp. An100 TaxID=1965538 RepID=UPI000B3A8F97|nr:class D sortase [Flavonifractor sp. An100]OUQ75361.1 sortase [Flavonifractor sp. An100]